MVPSTAAEVDAAWARRSLGLSDAQHDDGRAEPIGKGFGLASELLRVHLGGDAEPASVVVKLWDLDGAASGRELHVLHRLGRLGPRHPACLAGAVDQGKARAVLVLEDLVDVDQGDGLQQLSPEPAARVARLLADLHARWWRLSRLVAAADWLPPTPWLGLDRGWLRRRRSVFLDRFGSDLAPPTHGMLDKLEHTYPAAAEQLTNSAPTLLHDDVHLDNVVFDRSTNEPILLDWARASRGPAALDLVEVLLDVAEPAAASPALAAYLSRLRELGVPRADLDELHSDLSAAAIVSFARASCGVANWRPTIERELRLLTSGIERLPLRSRARLRDLSLD
ncbi:hypothetical protein ER308_02145 [Egibacter rhizosphaerae]|uniref:Aminoglycoside phosphotransferase domain-containing protein n=1 Tax=Egibacter rhizosphaerae TaxID=1670831 RepID=A0A411YB52_9ACTN|nr:phosphotransferase [Egibacter rhizosphaerae]QBI18483.1 hypothetical protein ER308_02145 [Egibacter rhizosphaerae]